MIPAQPRGAASTASHRGSRRRWTARWRGLSRRRAQAALGLAALVAFTLGSGSGTLVQALTADPAAPIGEATVIGPIAIALPPGLGPWENVPADRLRVVRESSALGAAEVEGVWGRLAPDALLVTVVRADTRDGLGSVAGPFDEEKWIPWDGNRPYLAGTQEAGGLCEIVLAIGDQDGGVILLSISGPPTAFRSGSLEEAVRQARFVG